MTRALNPLTGVLKFFSVLPMQHFTNNMTRKTVYVTLAVNSQGRYSTVYGTPAVKEFKNKKSIGNKSVVTR